MGDPTIGDLQKALYLNSAAALLKQAEAVHGAPALKPPAGVLLSARTLAPHMRYCTSLWLTHPAHATQVC